MEIVREVLRNVVSQHIADILKKFGADPVLLNGIDSGVLRCRTLREYMGQPIDLGLVGEITSIETETINQACDRGQVPVIAPIAVDEAGRLHNINADSIAGEICAGVHAEKMVYLSDIPGILRNTDDPESLLSSLKQSDVEPMIENGIIHGGMIPKIRACLKSLESGSKKTHVIDGRLQHSLLLEIFTDKGVGTEIVAG
jgi:acetylglutamate kinase